MANHAMQSVLNRINFLEGDVNNIKIQLEKTDDGNEIILLQKQLEGKEIRIDENKQWLRVLERDPGWGTLENVDGKYIPKLPTFKTRREAEYALEHPDHFREEDSDTTEQSFLGTREMVKRYHNEQALQRMDGDGPIAAEEKDVDRQAT
jgi:hypothetical protein